MTDISQPHTPDTTNDQFRKIWTSPRNLFGLFMTGLTGLFAAIAILPLAAIVINVASQGLPLINLDLFTKLPPPPGLSGGGLGNAIVGTLIVLGVAFVISTPIGVLGAVWLSELGGEAKSPTGYAFLQTFSVGCRPLLRVCSPIRLW